MAVAVAVAVAVSGGGAVAVAVAVSGGGAVAVAVAGLTKRFLITPKTSLYHLILVGRWPSPTPPNKRLGASRNRPMALAEAIPGRYPIPR